MSSSALESMLAAVSTMSEDMKRMSASLVARHEGHDHAVEDAMSTMASMSGMDMSTTSTMAGMAMTTASSMASSMASMSSSETSGMSGMHMHSATATTSAAAASATSAAMSGMSGMDMGGDECNISMIWNWNTIDSCFLSKGWHVKTSGQFAGTCIGIFLWVVFLVFVGSLRRKFDNYIADNGRRRYLRTESVTKSNSSQETVGAETTEKGARALVSNAILGPRIILASPENGMINMVRPTLPEQVLRAILYGFEYSTTWLLGLILMSYNGYVIISAFLGAALGYLFIEWDYIRHYENCTISAPNCC